MRAVRSKGVLGRLERPCEVVVLIGPLAPGCCDNIKGQIYIKRFWETLTYVGE